MIYKNANVLCIEGADGVGKTTLIKNLVKKCHRRYTVYDRGEISNYVYTKKRNLCYMTTQRWVPMIFVVLTCDENICKQRILSRAKEESWTSDDIERELQKCYDNKLFYQAYLDFKNDYDVIHIDTSTKNAEEVCDELISILNSRYESFLLDSDLSKWNLQYSKAAEKYSLDLKVIDNQLYINKIPIMVDAQLHNGMYETFSDKRFADNLLYSLSYDQSKIILNPKEYDFTYIINSKIKRRTEIYDYYNAFIKNGKTCQISDNPLIAENELLIRVPARKYFGEEYLSEISKARATVYCGRDLEYLKSETVRRYEAILTNLILFVDSKSDLNCEMLSQIYNCDKKLVDLLTVTPENICSKYDYIIKDRDLVEYILKTQREWYNYIVYKFEESIKNHTAFTLTTHTI